jgi:predicted RecA/RadA family phage recombinase
MKNFVKPGHTLTLTAPAGGVVSGTGYKIGQIFVVANADAAAGAKFEGTVVGVFDLPKAAAIAGAEGALAYWDDAAKNVTTVSAGKLCIGVFAAAAAGGDATARVRLNGIGAANSA